VETGRLSAYGCGEVSGGACTRLGSARDVQFRLRWQCPCGRLVPSSGELHHHYSPPNRSRLGVFTSRPHMVRGVHAHSACARGWSEPVPMVASSTLFCPLFSQNLRPFFAVAHAHRLARQRLVHVSAFLVRRPVRGSRPSGRGEVRGRARHPVHALAPVGLHERSVGMQRTLVFPLPLVRGLPLEQVDRLVADRGSRRQCVEVLVRDAPGLNQQGRPCKGPPRG